MNLIFKNPIWKKLLHGAPSLNSLTKFDSIFANNIESLNLQIDG